MYKDATYKQKLEDLAEWMPSIIEVVKKDLKQDHLRRDAYFVKKFLGSKNLNKLTNEELVDAYSRAIQEEQKAEEIAEFIASRWLIKNSDLYQYFEKQLSVIAPNFTELEELDAQKSKELIDASIAEFGAPHTYLFSVLNSVVFPEESFKFLQEKARHHHQAEEKKNAEAKVQASMDQKLQALEIEMARTKDKYEKKLSGLQKKYLDDVDALKKQVAQLQRKLQAQ